MNKKTLFSKITIILAALALVLGTATGFATQKVVSASADGEQKVHVYYGFKDLRSKTDFYPSLLEKRVIFVPASLGIDFSTEPCLPTIPAGSANLLVVDYDTGKTEKTDTNYNGHTAKSITDTQPASYDCGMPGTLLALVVNMQKGTGFDGCEAGGLALGDGSNSRDKKNIYYGCYNGGVSGRNCPGNVVSYNEKDVPISAIDAMVKPTKVIPSDETVIIEKQDIQMSFTIDGKNYMVPGTLSDADFKVDSTDNTVYISEDTAKLDDTIHVLFGTTSIPVKVHVHSWVYETNDDGDTLFAHCEVDGETCPVTETPQIKLLVHEGTCYDVDEKGDPIPAVGYDMNTAWNYVAGGAPTISYTSLDSEVTTTTPPTRKGNYRATLRAEGKDGNTYEIAKEFGIDKEGNITEVSGHVHQWKYTRDDNGIIHATCISKYGYCPYSTDSYQIEGKIDEGADPDGGDYSGVEIRKMGEADPYSDDDDDFPTPVVTYYEINPTTGQETKLSGAPTEAGSYRMKLEYENPDGEKIVGFTDFTIATDPETHENHINQEYRYVYPGTGIDRSKGYILYGESQNIGNDANTASKYNFVKFVPDAEINYDPNHEDLKNYAHATDGTLINDTYINMYDMTYHGSMVVAAYRLTSSGKWTPVKEGKSFGKDVLPGILSKGTSNLYITDNYDKAAKKPIGGTVYYFSPIGKPATVENMKACYDVCADEVGVTNGQFLFASTGQTRAVKYNISTTYEITFGPAGSKEKISWGWGTWPSTGGVWVPDAGTKEVKKGDKTTTTEAPLKYTIYLRTKATALHLQDGTTKYTAPSKEKKVTVSSSVKAPTVKVKYNTKIGNETGREKLTVKKGAYAYFLGNQTGIKDPLYEEVDATPVSDAAVTAKYDFGAFEGKKVEAKSSALNVDITNYVTESRNKILVWTAATGSKPASSKQLITLAKRQAITANALPVDNNGRVSLKVKNSDGTTTQYEIYDTAKNKWVTTIPASSTAGKVTYEIRMKSNAKGGAETDTMTANGISSQLTVTFDNISKSAKEKIGITKAEIEPLPVNND